MSEPETNVVTFTREQLYEQVWSQPMRHLAPTYGLSDVGLAKICRKLQIPTPPVGYWRRKEFGYEVDRPALPDLEDGQDSFIELCKAAKRTDEPLSEMEVLVQSERQDENRIVVSKTLDAPHPLVEKTDRSLRAAKVDAEGLVRPRAHGCLAVSVGPRSIDRAMRILDATLKALESRGFPVTPDDEKDGYTHVEVLGETIQFQLSEVLDKNERQFTPAQKRERERYSWLSTPRPEYDYFPSGRLSLVIAQSSGGTGTRRRWSDGQNQPLEGLLNRFVAGLIKAADDAKEARRQREEWDRQLQEERRKRHEAEIQRRESETRTKDFDANCAAWHRARELRQFIEAVRAEAIRRHGFIDDQSDLARWLVWAERCVASMDPIHESRPLPKYAFDEETKERWRQELSFRGW